jgi:heme exporter protein B
MKQIYHLIQKDLRIEWRQRYALSGMLLHVFSSVFVVYLCTKILNAPSWNALLWIVILFSSITIASKSFIAENKGRHIYYYTIASAEAMIISKIFLNTILVCINAILCFGVYVILMGNPVVSIDLYFIILCLGATGFAAAFTMMSSLSSKSGNGSLLMPVLSMPVVIPFLMIVIRASKKAMDGLDSSLITKDILVIALLIFLITAMAYILFPFLWKD